MIALAAPVTPTRPVIARLRESRAPRITSLKPAAAAPNSVMQITGYGLYQEDWNSQRVLFIRKDVEVVAARLASGGSLTNPDSLQYGDVAVPETLTPGTWLLVVEINGRRSAPIRVTITEKSDPVITGVSPARPHPAQMVLLSTDRSADLGSRVELTDASGAQWSPQTGVSSRIISVLLPDEVAEGEATVRVRRTEHGVDTFSAPFRLFVTSAPLPLNPSAVARMKPVAPGQWTDLVDDNEIGFELERADRIDVEFRQGDVAVINQATGDYRSHVQVPATIAAGQVSVRTRTWIEQTASEWSVPATFRVRGRPVPPSITWIDAGPARDLVWWPGANTPAFVPVTREEVLVLHGLFPVARPVDLRIQLKRTRETYDLSPMDVTGGVQVEIPAQLAPGDWRLVIGTTEGLTPLQEVTTLRAR